MLASKSPRRREILASLGVRFRVLTADTDETCDEKDPASLVLLLSERKAVAAANAFVPKREFDTAFRKFIMDTFPSRNEASSDDPPIRVPYKPLAVGDAPQKERVIYPFEDPGEDYIVGCDTVVAVEGEILGKPKDEEDAKRMLRLLSGRTHSVFSGLHVIRFSDRKSAGAVRQTHVTFAPLSEEDIAFYIRHGSVYDKAGAYAVQGLASAFIKEIEGDYFNVVGFPVQTFFSLMEKDFGLAPTELLAKMPL